MTTYVAILIQILFFYFLLNKNKILFFKVFSFTFFLYFVFIIKNFINSGCLIFPLGFTCLEPLWGIEVEALNNDYSLQNLLNTVINFSEKTFSYGHVVIRYSIILLIIFLLLYLLSFRKNNESIYNLDYFLKIKILVFIFSTIIFFYFIKNIRFGWYNFYILLSLLFLIIAKNHQVFINKYLKPNLFIFCTLLIFSQNLFFLFLDSNFSNKNFDENFKIINASNFSYKLGSDQGFCFDVLPPCSNYKINENIEIKKIYNYNFYVKEN